MPFYYGQSGWGEELVFVKTMAQLCAVNTGKTHLGIGTVPRMNYGEKINVIVKPGEGFAIPSILENEMNRIQSSGVVPKIVDRISNELWAPLDEDEKIDICGGYLRAESADIMYHSAIIIAEDGIYFYKAYGDRPHLVSRWHDISFKSLGMRYLNENNMAYCLSIEIIKELLEKKSPDIPIDLSGFFAGSDIGNHYDNSFSVATPMGAGKLYTLVEFERYYYIRPASGLTEW